MKTLTNLKNAQILVKTSVGDLETYYIQSFTPMQYPDKKSEGFLPVHDVEVILHGESNIFFSLKRFLSGKSWVSEFAITGKFISTKGKYKPIIPEYKLEQMEWSDMKIVDDMVKEFVLRQKTPKELKIENIQNNN